MSAKYFAILTNQGAARLANAAALGTQLSLTQMAVGDANGVLPTPDPAQTALVNQRRIAPINLIDVDPKNPAQIIVEQVIPENEGGFWIREIGLYDNEGLLIAVANCPETYKPLLQEGSGRTQTIRMVLIVSSTAAVTLRIDPAVVLATRKYADDKAIEVKAYADDLMAKHLTAADPHPKYAQIDSPTFKGTPKAPTPPVISNDTRMATTEFVQAVISALVSGALANKQPLDKTLTDLSGKAPAAILEYLGIREASTTQAGIVRLSDNTGVPDSTTAATTTAVNHVLNLANSKYSADGATTETPGLVQLVNSIGGSGSLVMPQSAVTTAIQTAPSLGKGQALWDMKSERALGATYTNHTGYPIAVYIRTNGGTSANIYVYVNDIEFGGGGSTASQVSLATAFFIVPPGATYRTLAPGVSLIAWSELR